MGKRKKQPLSEVPTPNGRHGRLGSSLTIDAIDGLSKAVKRGDKPNRPESLKAEDEAKRMISRRIRQRAAAVDDEIVAAFSESGSDDEWEPDWMSEDDEGFPLVQEEGVRAQTTEGGLLELQVLVSCDEVSDTPLPPRRNFSKGNSSKPRIRQKRILEEGEPTQTKSRKKSGQRAKRQVEELEKSPADGTPKDEEEEEEKPYSDDEIWQMYEEQVELEEAYVPKVLPEMEPPKELLMPLLPYQKGFLGWAVAQEKGDIKGGILADEMGMGKTIQAISLIVCHRTDDNSKLEQLEAAPLVAPQATKPDNRSKLTLMNPCPVPATSQSRVPNNAQAPQNEGAVEAACCMAEHQSVAYQIPSNQINNAETVVPDMPADQSNLLLSNRVQAFAELQTAQSLKGPEALIPSCDRPTPSRVMAVGNSHCGRNEHVASGPSGKFSRATLVICPVVAVIQWREEMAKYVEAGTLKVVVYHGNKRASSAEELEQADVVLTTYSIAESEFRRHTQPIKATCTYCNKKFYPDRLKVHLRFFCGPNAKKSDALAKQQKKRPRAGELHGFEGDDGFQSDKARSVEESSNSDLDDDVAKTWSKKSKTGKSTKFVLQKGRPISKQGSLKVRKEGKEISKKAAFKASKDGKAGKQGEKQAAKGSKKPAKGAGCLKSKAQFEATEEQSISSGEEMSGAKEDEKDGCAGSVKVKNAGGWAVKALEEAEEMIAEAAQTNEKVSDPGISILHKVRWRRIILDEAHSIKDRRSSTARAIFALESNYKWALSGTPLQNRVSELYSLVRFLRLYPYAYYFCNSGRSRARRNAGKQEPCSCKSLDYSFRTNWRQCDHCGHSPLHHYCYWNKWVANPIKKYGYVGRGQSAMLLLKTEILEKILLRRTKIQCADVLALPPRSVVLRKDKFDEREEDFYEALYTQSQAQFDSYVQTSTVLNNYAHVFSLLVRLRQAVNHPYLVVHSATTPEDGPVGQQVGACTICHDPLEDGIAAKCGHAFCRACITEYLQSASGTPICLSCDKPITINLANAPKATASRMVGSSKNSIINRISLSNFQSSTKIEALLEELYRMMARDPASKAIVFSQFTSMLDLIHFRLQQVGINCVRLEGSMEMKQRDRMIERFSADASVKVFLMSLKAGGVALNLTAASHVMLMDPWWNPAVEQQAQDRIHRLGQYKPIHVTRYVIGGTIEERILKLQEKKQLVFEGTVGQDKEALGRLTEDDLRFLFA